MVFITDNTSNASSSTISVDTIFTPPPSIARDDRDPFDSPTTGGGEFWDGHVFPAVPSPQNTYMIIEKASGCPVIRTADGRISLGGHTTTTTTTNMAMDSAQWLCVESNNNFGFQNPQTGCYLGHDGEDIVQAKAEDINEREHIFARPHPKGGYHLLTKCWLHTMKLITIDKDGKSLVRRMHGTTIFYFKKFSEDTDLAG
ncbi:hypothetical protein PG991_009198 [Apiospora marii]|uniref:Ricin B lectin domain-containing protein n=1 Tax=Apiospora marii TaxID=335849 RepID=A0ABR1RJZ4_9PEZI